MYCPGQPSTTRHVVSAHVEELIIEPESPGSAIPCVGLSHFVIPYSLASIDDTTPASTCVSLLSYFIRLRFELVAAEVALEKLSYDEIHEASSSQLSHDQKKKKQSCRSISAGEVTSLYEEAYPD
ncbi:hypothetical protein LIER_25158 [Lithospermum erythrorhizon]|uniref:Uncharacterized protein n=1 Tax=Lithospermum erythrorhizon TaxID=34254 RepID=A0AAV3R4Y8_LITER